MAYKGLKVMDSDMHVMEPGDLWKRYMDPEYRNVAPASPENVRLTPGSMESKCPGSN